MAVLLIFIGLLGLVVGSFLNVVIHRVPAGISVATPPSACPNCDVRIRVRHNVPVLGWLLLRGKCFDCKEPISARYPLVELLTGLLFVAVALRVSIPDLPAYLYFTAIGVALSAIDLDTRRLPNAIVLPSYPVIAVLLTASAAWQRDFWPLLRAGVGGVVLFAFFFMLATVYPAGMGFGDVKLAGLIGMVLGYLSWRALLIGSFGGFLLGAVVGVVVMAVRKGGRRTALPFGPFMVAGALLAMFTADAIADGYVKLLLQGLA
ncbi:A24 family peptidase [Kutzneria buriramensis]|uniref:Leader peptidase (Prepilin peptidase)/N-methyltransferase n=1 Tax=Kutzneria buriramensis TaxID=1045776 RepID=A0A3E0GZ93_9PSEU|nr:A24 family peptidase [Kutzneria buriramensis]REH33127.1 leader peptidase (prepilin peptidase)/N-methyltransferase [Kutzneria buriramensis]